MLMIQNELAGSSQGSSLGLLIMRNVMNLPSHSKLDEVKNELTDFLRKEYHHSTRDDLKSIYPLNVYVSYYKKFGYSYHVLLQLESIILRSKSIPTVSSLVEAMFIAELKNMILTSGHDLEKIILPLNFKTASGEEHYTGFNGKELLTVSKDMMVTDSKGVISSILRGPDLRTCIGKSTRHVLFSAYAPSGINKNSIYQHLNDIETYVGLFSPEAITYLKEVV